MLFFIVLVNAAKDSNVRVTFATRDKFDGLTLGFERFQNCFGAEYSSSFVESGSRTLTSRQWRTNSVDRRDVASQKNLRITELGKSSTENDEEDAEVDKVVSRNDDVEIESPGDVAPT